MAVVEMKRVKTYDYDEWLRTGYYLSDYDFDTGEYILKPFDKPITSQQARLLSYNSIHDLTPEQVETIWPKEKVICLGDIMN